MNTDRELLRELVEAHDKYGLSHAIRAKARAYLASLPAEPEPNLGDIWNRRNAEPVDERKAFEEWWDSIPCGERDYYVSKGPLGWGERVWQAARAAAPQQTEPVAPMPVATFGGRRHTPTGTLEFWGTLLDGAINLSPRDKLYVMSAPPASVSGEESDRHLWNPPPKGEPHD